MIYIYLHHEYIILLKVCEAAHCYSKKYLDRKTKVEYAKWIYNRILQSLCAAHCDSKKYFDRQTKLEYAEWIHNKFLEHLWFCSL